MLIAVYTTGAGVFNSRPMSLAGSMLRWWWFLWVCPDAIDIKV